MLFTLLHLAASLSVPSAWEWRPQPAEWALNRAARTAVATARVCRAALLGEHFDPAGSRLGVACRVEGYIGGYTYVKSHGTPLVLVFEGHDGPCRLVPLSFYRSQITHARTLAGLQGCWGVHSVYLGQYDSRRLSLRRLPSTWLFVSGQAVCVADPVASRPVSLVEVQRWGWLTMLRPAYLTPADRTKEHLWYRAAGTSRPWLDLRLVVPVGGLRLVANFNPHGVELGVWHRRALPTLR